MKRGSTWRKWDLHIHTPASFECNFRFLNKHEGEKYQGNIWGKYIDALENISEISVLGITDYFTIDGFIKILEYLKSGRLSNFDLILPNIEFRLDQFVGEKRLNYHVIFSEEIEANIIEKEFLEELHITAPNAETRKLNKRNIEEIGKTIKRQQASFRGRSDYHVGCGNITVSLEDIIHVLESKKSIFGGKYVLVLPEQEWSLINDWTGQDHLTRKSLLVRSGAMFSSNPRTRDWALGKMHENPEAFVEEFGCLKACMHGSDAHSFESLCKPDEDRFCWIKADPTFEGLKQIIYEPEERVRIQPENPENRKNVYTLDSVEISNSFVNSELAIKEQKIPLNQNLVAVTGGKGSGKTALLDLIANCFEPRCITTGGILDTNSFAQRIELDKKDLKTEIGFLGDDIDEFSKELTEKVFCQDSKITYLPQGKIEEYSGHRQQLDRKTEEIIFKNKEVIAGGYKTEFDRLKEEIDLFAERIDQINNTIYRLERETREEVISEVASEKKISEGNLRDKEDQLKKLTQGMAKGLKERIEELKEQEKNLRVQHSKLERIKADLVQIESNIKEFSDTQNKTIASINRELCELNIKLQIPLLEFSTQLNASKKVLKRINQKITSVIKQFGEITSQLTQLSGEERTHAEILREIEMIKINIQNLKERLKELKGKKREIKDYENERAEKYLSLIRKYWEWKQYYDEVIEVFSRGKTDIMGGIDFRSRIYFDKYSFVEFGSELFDLRRINVDRIEKYATELESAITQGTPETLTENVMKLIQKLLENKYLLKTSRTSYDFYKWIFDDYFSLSTKIFFTGRPMEKLSIGLKGTVLLKLFLAEGDYPLIVDQPEENLDNKYIYGELVGAFREAKKQRQVIIATNNANLVINTDAEQVIVAEFEDNIITYKLGSIEDLEVRKDIVPILEGSKEAFKKREEKYGIYV